MNENLIEKCRSMSTWDNFVVWLKYVLSEICAKCNEICNMIKVLAPSMNVILMNEMLHDEAAKTYHNEWSDVFRYVICTIVDSLMDIYLVLCPKRCKLCRIHKEVDSFDWHMSRSLSKKSASFAEHTKKLFFVDLRYRRLKIKRIH